MNKLTLSLFSVSENISIRSIVGEFAPISSNTYQNHTGENYEQVDPALLLDMLLKEHERMSGLTPVVESNRPSESLTKCSLRSINIYMDAKCSDQVPSIFDLSSSQLQQLVDSGECQQLDQVEDIRI